MYAHTTLKIMEIMRVKSQGNRMSDEKGKPKAGISSWDLFRQVKPGEDLPPPPPEIIQMAKVTTISVCVGSIASGLLAFRREALVIQEELEHFKKDDQNRPIMTKKEARTFHNRKLSKLSQAGVRGGLYLGGFTALFSGIEIASSRVREQTDFWNTIVAGATTGAVFGLRNGIKYGGIGAAVGAAISAPLGLLKDFAYSQGLVEPPKPHVPSDDVPVPNISHVVQSLEAQLRDVQEAREIASKFGQQTPPVQPAEPENTPSSDKK